MQTSKRSVGPATRAHGTAIVWECDDDTPRASSVNAIDARFEGLKSSTIMMVDDEPTTIEVLETFLEGEGYSNFVTTTDSRQALDLLEEATPDVLLLDLMMPNIGGLEILSSMRHDEAFRDIPVIILTSSTEAETKLKALELGATDFLGKPVDPSELALRLRNTLATKAYQDRLAYYDDLTGLPNRLLFMKRLDRALQSPTSGLVECAVLYIDLDRFQQVNDALGRSAGDALLKAVADRLGKCVRADDLLGTMRMPQEGSSLSRVGGDEFAVFLPGVGEPAARVARRVVSSLAEPFHLGGDDLFVTPSIGIALFPDDGANIETLLRNAESAMSHASQRGGNGHQFYSASLNAESLERLSLENRLRKALDGEELLLHYQPKVDFRTGQIIGAEALMRWQHPELGLVPPTRFIPIAEEIDLIGSLGEWALRTACRQNREWQSAGFRPIQIAVNVSSKQFRPGKLLETIRVVLQDSGMGAEYLVLELTESLIMESPQETSKILHGIKGMGVKISVDDFGTGYSSLNSLKRFPLDELKIDRSFVKGIPYDADDVGIVTAIIGMAHTLGMTVVAEGVETEEQLAFLEERGCDEYQGFLFSRPVPPEQWTGLFESNTAKTQRR